MKLDFGGLAMDLSQPRVMGILNVTPDSFSDGGQFDQLDTALAQVERMISEGADFIDVGGESTRPGAAVVSEQQELDRVVPVIEGIRQRFPVAISVDTSTPSVMTAAAVAGANLINDVRALQREGALAAARESGLPICLMHMQGDPESMQNQPEYDSVVDEVASFLARRVADCQLSGIAKNRLIVDPGFGFGKTLEHNLQLLKELKQFRKLDLPVLVGVSRKSMIGQLLDKPVDQRLHGSLAAAVAAVLNGASILRVHDVGPTVDALKVTSALKTTF
mgnify:CR=1 FL=1